MLPKMMATENGVEPFPTGLQHDDAADDDACRNERVGHHVEEGSADVKVGVLSGDEEQSCRGIDGDASGGDPDDRHSPNWRRVTEAADGFPGDCPEGGEQDDGVDERRQD